jgi:S-adenosylmethionine:tRNA ribosyltransferase-isomerase
VEGANGPAVHNAQRPHVHDANRLAAYDYHLPAELIASHPPAERDGARMMVLDRKSGTLAHHHFRDLPAFLSPADLLVLNDSKVIRARLTGDGIEALLVEPLGASRWRCLVKPGRRFRIHATGTVANTRFTVEAVEDDGCRILGFEHEPDHQRHGLLPIPPYLHRSADASDDIRYQTVYAGEEGSVAAPTAGLHFTPSLLASIPHATLTLHVGIGTFLPVKCDDLSLHQMHSERYSISPQTSAALNAASRLVAVGTTVTRVLESQPEGPIAPHSSRTNLFIRPPFTFHRVSSLLTNFHLPKSSLLMLISAFAGRDLILQAYHEAIQHRYRFFSYGDCMLIL